MKDIKAKYTVVNAFSNISESERKKKINEAIRTLCFFDIEKNMELDYNMSVAFYGSVSDPKNEERSKC